MYYQFNMWSPFLFLSGFYCNYITTGMTEPLKWVYQDNNTNKKSFKQKFFFFFDGHYFNLNHSSFSDFCVSSWSQNKATFSPWPAKNSGIGIIWNWGHLFFHGGEPRLCLWRTQGFLARLVASSVIIEITLQKLIMCNLLPWHISGISGDNSRWVHSQHSENSRGDTKGENRKQAASSSATWCPDG